MLECGVEIGKGLLVEVIFATKEMDFAIESLLGNENSVKQEFIEKLFKI